MEPQQRMKFRELTTRSKIATVLIIIGLAAVTSSFSSEPSSTKDPLLYISMCGLNGNKHIEERKRISKYIWNKETHLDDIKAYKKPKSLLLY